MARFFKPGSTYVRDVPTVEVGRRPAFKCRAVACDPSHEDQLIAYGEARAEAESDWQRVQLSERVWQLGWTECG